MFISTNNRPFKGQFRIFRIRTHILPAHTPNNVMNKELGNCPCIKCVHLFHSCSDGLLYLYTCSGQRNLLVNSTIEEGTRRGCLGLGSRRRLVGRRRWLLHVIILITCRSNSAAQFKLLEHQFVETNRQITTSFCLAIKLELVCTVRAIIRVVRQGCVYFGKLLAAFITVLFIYWKILMKNAPRDRGKASKRAGGSMENMRVI